MAGPEHDRDDDHDHDRDRKPDNDNERRDVAAPAGGALTSLTALAAALNAVDTSRFVGAGMPMMLFKREGDGSWMYGQRKIVPESDSRWAVNPQSFKYGYVCFGNNNKKLGEHLVPVTEPMPDVTKLPDKGAPWTEQWSVNLKCLSGTDAGVEVIYKTTTDGGIKAVMGLAVAVRDRLNGGQHDGKIAPIVLLQKGSYPHVEHGKVWFPVTEIVDWMPLTGPAPAPASTPEPSPSPEQQPRRRRVG